MQVSLSAPAVLRNKKKTDYEDESFINTSPEIIKMAASIRIAVAGSPNIKIPTRKEPIAPIPVQIVYAVPKGKVRIAYANKAKLKIIKTRVIILGPIRVKPSDSFMEYAHTISKIPAKISTIQAMTTSKFKSKIRSS